MMGIDVEFKARPFDPMTDVEFEDLRARFLEAMPLDVNFGDRRYPDLRWDKYDRIPTIEVATLERYYGPGYERGRWPAIKAMGDWLAVNLGERAELRYGSDVAYEWEQLTQWATARAECDSHWEQYENRPYREFFQRRNR